MHPNICQQIHEHQQTVQHDIIVHDDQKYVSVLVINEKLHVVINQQIHIIHLLQQVIAVAGVVMLDIIRIVVIHVQRVERIITVVHVLHQLEIVYWQTYDIMQIHHLVRQHVRMHLQTQNIQVMDTVIIVAGDVKHDTIRMEAHVQHVQVDIQVLHEQRQKVVVIRHVVRDTLFQVH